MQKETHALKDNVTWSMETFPPGKKSLGCKWVYKIKYNSDGSIERLKARLVIFCNHQIEGIYYNETFALVENMLHQIDVRNSFLHGDLDEEVYIKLLSVYVDDLIISGNDSTALKTFKGYLSSYFYMKDREVAHSFLDIFICQRKYTLDIISETVFLGAKPVRFPIEKNHRLAHATGAVLNDLESYIRLISHLIYLEMTTPNLAYLVHSYLNLSISRGTSIVTWFCGGGVIQIGLLFVNSAFAYWLACLSGTISYFLEN
ncbi:Cysteine-rich RLK (RECEPTOR-like protein kinase) 8 [Gossypium australe]|uniref:Cysteine-rich RLK (RECEPTOR-like protein kinase) 8 n=1 Tax=Gossypium australe TaxID=47621 RepID=A0A5B6W9R8_9ROSI|nr:Cysteine-rich RLK (RECEPTOR-like protein kinase) 8 [Gossypium australe]